MKIMKTRKYEALIPTCSMADIAFLLIVFFMISTVFQVDKTPVALPESSRDTRREVVKESAFIVVEENGTIRASDGIEESRLVNMEDISALAASWMSKKSEQPVVIKADSETPYGVIDDILQHVREAGVTNLKFLTEQNKGPQ